jgi:hypothetical protein
MLIKAGVDISRLLPPIRKKLNEISRIWSRFDALPLVITSTYEGTHSASSLHYANLAIDIRRPAGAANFIEALKAALGRDYDIILEYGHVHIEYDPK